MRTMRILAVILAFMLAGICAFARPLMEPEAGDAAVDFSIELLDETGLFRLSDHRGKVVFLNIWATWCDNCVAEMQHIEKLANTYPDDLVVLGVSTDFAGEIAADFVEKNGYTYNFAWDVNHLVSGLLYPSSGIPNNIFINPDGIITCIQLGGISYEMMEQRFLESLSSVENVE